MLSVLDAESPVTSLTIRPSPVIGSCRYGRTNSTPTIAEKVPSRRLEKRSSRKSPWVR
jgi:hypothetical protein